MTRIHIHGDFVSKNSTVFNLDNTGGAIRIANLEGPILGLGGGGQTNHNLKQALVYLATRRLLTFLMKLQTSGSLP